MLTLTCCCIELFLWSFPSPFLKPHKSWLYWHKQTNKLISCICIFKLLKRNLYCAIKSITMNVFSIDARVILMTWYCSWYPVQIVYRRDKGSVSVSYYQYLLLTRYPGVDPVEALPGAPDAPAGDPGQVPGLPVLVASHQWASGVSLSLLVNILQNIQRKDGAFWQKIVVK